MRIHQRPRHGPTGTSLNHLAGRAIRASGEAAGVETEAWRSTTVLAAVLRDIATGAARRRAGDPADRLTGVAFAPDGRILAATGNDADIRLWDLGEILKTRAGP